MKVGRYFVANLLLPYVSVTAFRSDFTSKPAPRKQDYRRCQTSSSIFIDTVCKENKSNESTDRMKTCTSPYQNSARFLHWSVPFLVPLPGVFLKIGRTDCHTDHHRENLHFSHYRSSLIITENNCTLHLTVVHWSSP